MSAVGSSQVIPFVEEYFEDRIAGDLSKVTWKHAVNNVQLLDEALKGTMLNSKNESYITYLSSNLMNSIYFCRQYGDDAGS